MDVYLIRTKEGLGYTKDDELYTFNNETQALINVAEIVGGALDTPINQVELVSVHKANLDYGTLIQLGVTILKGKLKFREVPGEAPTSCPSII